MNIHPEAPGRLRNMGLASRSLSGYIYSPSVQSLALSLHTKAPCLLHFPGQLIVKCLTCSRIVIETLWIRFHTADKRAFRCREQGLSINALGIWDTQEHWNVRPHSKNGRTIRSQVNQQSCVWSMNFNRQYNTLRQSNRAEPWGPAKLLMTSEQGNIQVEAIPLSQSNKGERMSEWVSENKRLITMP